jgi:hypothetical protein
MLGGMLCPGWESNSINGPKQRMQERANSVECFQRRHPPEEDEWGSGDGREDHGDGFELSMAEIARQVGVATSSIPKAVARLEEEG